METWICKNCETINKGDYCDICGNAKIYFGITDIKSEPPKVTVPKIVIPKANPPFVSKYCNQCGTKYSNYLTSKYCSNCGKKRTK